MNEYIVRRSAIVWEENRVMAENEEEAIDKAYEGGEWKIMDSDTRDIEVELA